MAGGCGALHHVGRGQRQRRQPGAHAGAAARREASRERCELRPLLAARDHRGHPRSAPPCKRRDREGDARPGRLATYLAPRLAPNRPLLYASATPLAPNGSNESWANGKGTGPEPDPSSCARCPSQLVAAITAVAAAAFGVVLVAVVVVVVALVIVVVDVSVLSLRSLRRLGRLGGRVLFRNLLRLRVARLGCDLGLFRVQRGHLAVHAGPGESVRDLHVRRHAQRGHEHSARGDRDCVEERPSHCSPLDFLFGAFHGAPAAYQRPTSRESEPANRRSMETAPASDRRRRSHRWAQGSARRRAARAPATRSVPGTRSAPAIRWPLAIRSPRASRSLQATRGSYPARPRWIRYGKGTATLSPPGSRPAL